MDVDEGEESSSGEEDAPSPSKKPRLSSYEVLRDARIAANAALFESMGLGKEAQNFQKTLKAGSRKQKTRRPPASITPRVTRSTSKKSEHGPPSSEVDARNENGGARDENEGQDEGPDSLASSGTQAPETMAESRPKPRQASNKQAPIEPGSPSTTAAIGRDVPEEMAEGGGVVAEQQPSGIEDDESLGLNDYAILEEANELLIEAPPYLTDTLQRMKEKDVGMLGRPWDMFVARLLLLESEGEFNMPMKDLPAGSAKDGTQRPPMLAAWVKNGRCRRNAENVPKEMPLLAPAELQAHVKAFWGWWGMMQPAWREFEGGRWAKHGFDGAVSLGDLNTRGTCGWLSVVACMWWWGVCVHEGEDEAAKQAWQVALGDVDWMLAVVLLRGEREGKE
ncbi:hypothetical protein CYLTODRAFT_495521 [Cylindrobasidium torrendii FP15055 ss-10]|uniref:Uncharacterized protein n=1 Tax=Cylindrobasidium torrendii FP15055 ss-10 TaxID=1314674 RepID=A0A0D7AU18_9AGAR|nr:hypothetical protein CYLTODRAFT_495521 [Cylindrobasidium torrendii FP15055 ss-10]